MSYNIQEITSKRALEIIDNPDAKQNIGSFLIRENNSYTAIDNTTTNAWTEDFKTKAKAIAWLNGKE